MLIFLFLDMRNLLHAILFADLRYTAVFNGIFMIWILFGRNWNILQFYHLQFFNHLIIIMGPKLCYNSFHSIMFSFLAKIFTKNYNDYKIQNCKNSLISFFYNSAPIFYGTNLIRSSLAYLRGWSLRPNQQRYSNSGWISLRFCLSKSIKTNLNRLH